MNFVPHLPSHFAILFAAALLCAAIGCAPSEQAARDASLSQARADNEKAFVLIEEGKYADAEALLRGALEADPNFGQARNNLGLVYYHLGNLYQAAWEFEQAAKLMPNRGEPHNNLGLVYERAGQLNRAIDAYTQARQYDLASTEFLANLARARVRRGDIDVDIRQLLEQLVLRETRSDWRDWARNTLARLNAIPPMDLTTRPS